MIVAGSCAMSPTSHAPQGDPPTEPVARGSRNTDLIYTGVAVVGSLILVTFAYGAARWGSVDSVVLLALVFGVLLVAFSVAAVFGVRSRVIAPFVVAALLLPWLCGAAAVLGMGHRVGDVFDALTNGADSALMDGVSPDGSDDEWTDPAEGLSAGRDDDGEFDGVEEYATPPDDVSGAVPRGEPVRYSQQTGPDPAETAEWEVTVTEVECGLAELPGADLTSSGQGVDALPRVGHEFCL
ncbi:MAG TPA: hypothetical protein GX718_04725, partial [Brevibacterium sp.]|nr:hypothetical protein [Brevibacterium sp.]